MRSIVRNSRYLIVATRLRVHPSDILFVFSLLSSAGKSNLIFALVPCLTCTLLVFITSSDSVVSGPFATSATVCVFFPPFFFIYYECEHLFSCCLYICWCCKVKSCVETKAGYLSQSVAAPGQFQARRLFIGKVGVLQVRSTLFPGLHTYLVLL